MVELRVTDIFHITGRGTVLAASVISGTVGVGDRLRVKSPGAIADFTVAGLEQDRTLVTSAKAGEKVAVLTRRLDLDSVADGFRRLDQGGYEVHSLVLVEQPRKWWEFWR